MLCPPMAARCTSLRRCSTSTTGGWQWGGVGHGGGGGCPRAAAAPCCTHTLPDPAPPPGTPALLHIPQRPRVPGRGRPAVPLYPDPGAPVGWRCRQGQHPQLQRVCPAAQPQRPTRRPPLLQGDASTERTRRGVHVRVEGRARIRGVQAFRAGQVGGRAGGPVEQGRVRARLGPTGRVEPAGAARCSPQPTAPSPAPLALTLPRPCPIRPAHPQNNVLGAYPFHWHFAGDASGQYATDCAVYRWAGLMPGACWLPAAAHCCPPVPAHHRAAPAPSLPPLAHLAGPSTAASRCTPPATCCCRTTWGLTRKATASTSRRAHQCWEC